MDAVDLKVRRATRADVPAITEIYNEAVETTTATFDIEPRTIEDRMAWLNAYSERFAVLVGELDGRVVGWTSLRPWSGRAGYDGTAETALYVHSEYRGRGIGRKLKLELIDEARRQGFHALIVRVTEDSKASIQLNLATGFVHVGTLKEVGRKFGRLLNVHIMQKILD
jgi:L-amino acid N-acyltransferase YncA